MIEHQDKILQLQDGTLICGFCMKPITIEKKHEWDEYEKYEWTEYSCSCDEWKAYDQLNQDIMKLDWEYYNKLKRIVADYRQERAELVKKANECSPKQCVMTDFNSYILDVMPPSTNPHTKNEWIVK